MSNKKQLKQANEEIFNTTNFFVKYIKRYGITLLIAVPIILVLNYVLSKNFAWYTGAVSFFVSFFLLLLACFIALIIFTKKDDRKKQKSTKELERDPFAD